MSFWYREFISFGLLAYGAALCIVFWISIMAVDLPLLTRQAHALLGPSCGGGHIDTIADRNGGQEANLRGQQ